MSCRSKMMLELEAQGMGRAGSFQEGFKHQSPQTQQLNKPLLLPAWPPSASLLGCLSDLRHPSVIPNLSSQVQHWLYLEQEGWGQVLLCPSEVTWLFKAGAASLGLTYRSKWKWFLPWAAHHDLQPSGEIYSSYPGLFIICEAFMTSGSS